MAGVTPSSRAAAAWLPRSTVRITWVEVDDEDVLESPSAVLLTDDDVGAYRLGVGGNGRRPQRPGGEDERDAGDAEERRALTH